MAGFWIAWEVGLTKKQEIFVISKKLGVSRREAAAMCMEVWEWAQNISIDGLIPGINASDVSEAVSVNGIGEAMEKVGWLLNGDGSVQFPKWDRYNGRSAKSRFLNASRVRNHRNSVAIDKAHKRNG